MEKSYYLAVDIGASSGRHILSHMENGKIVLEEIYRFSNENDITDGHRLWDTERLFSEVVKGMKKCSDLGKIPVSMGIDTWGVDYVLLDKNGQRLGPCYAYRDSRTEKMDEEVYKIIPQNELYARTGIQKAIFNTIYQLMAMKSQEPEVLDKAETLLMVPDYLHFLLTGNKLQEYTNASTTQLVDPKTNEWDYELIEKLGFPKKLFNKLNMPGTFVGGLLPAIKEQVGFDTKVVLPATHDTGSAVMSVPSNSEDVLYISSGTWSLMGCELLKANTTPDAEKANFTNEGGYDHRYRFLKNIMGLWMIQSIRRELNGTSYVEGKTSYETAEALSSLSDYEKGRKYSFGDLEMAARGASSYHVTVNVNDNRFMNPESMIAEVAKAAAETGKPPSTIGELMQCVYMSLAECYADAIRNLSEITGKTYTSVNIVGGGSQDKYLNALTADATGLEVFAGPTEGTAIGNLIVQMIAAGEFADLAAARAAIAR